MAQDRLSMKLDPELELLISQLSKQHSYVHRHRLARLAFRAGLRELAALGPEDVRERLTRELLEHAAEQP